MTQDPFSVDFASGNLLRRAMMGVAPWLVERALDLTACRRIYRDAQAAGEGPFERRVLRALAVEPLISTADLDRIARNGPLLVAANHPHGAIDGLLLADAVRRVRPDVRVVTNHLLARIPELADLCFFVDAFHSGANATTFAGLRAAHLWLRRGGALVMFPAGEVAHCRDKNGTRTDSAWRPTAAALASATGALMLPAFIQGANGRLFYAAGRIHPLLRTALLPRELTRTRGRTITVRIGEPMPPVTPTAEVRNAVDALSSLPAPRRHTVTGAAEREVAALPPASCLVESGRLQVFCVDAAAIPATLREIGRLRERTYRAVGEGTGRVLDVDRFDQHYLHLFSWDLHHRRVVGAYRIARTDRIVAARGVAGLYTRTLFRYDQRLLQRFGAPALELGRSFVRSEYQKHYDALLLLWKGLGQFIVRNPQYRVLFGPVSISSRYSDTSHQLLTAFLRQNHLERDLSELVEALNPARAAPGAATLIPASIDDVNRLVAAVERDGKGVPVLLRQYLKLNARLIGFNVDPDFGDALDALMMVDLASVDRAILNRYLGRRGAADFLAHHAGAYDESKAVA